MLGSFWDHFGIILESFWDHFSTKLFIPGQRCVRERGAKEAGGGVHEWESPSDPGSATTTHPTPPPRKPAQAREHPTKGQQHWPRGDRSIGKQ